MNRSVFSPFYDNERLQVTFMKKFQLQLFEEILTPTSENVFIAGQKKLSCFQEEIFLALI